VRRNIYSRNESLKKVGIRKAISSHWFTKCDRPWAENGEGGILGAAQIIHGKGKLWGHSSGLAEGYRKIHPFWF